MISALISLLIILIIMALVWWIFSILPLPPPIKQIAIGRERAPALQVAMPLRSGSSSDVVSSNISELEHGRVVGKTKRKYGKKRAQRQAVAIRA